jgi:hypothetical protein
MTTSKAPDDVTRQARSKDAPEGAPLHVDTPAHAEPGPDVSNADIDLQSVSADAAHSTYVPNPDPNPQGLHPAPGPSTIQVLGVPDAKAKTDDPSNTFEETR